MQKILKVKEIDFETNLKVEDIMEIVDKYISEKKEQYEVNDNSILYDPESHVTNEPVWYVDIISLKIKKMWPDAYISLAISDKEKRVVYVANDHGVVIEKF